MPVAPRVVLDTNVWISGIFFRKGAPARLLDSWIDGRFQIIITASILSELAGQLRKKTERFGASPKLADQWLGYIDVYAEFVLAQNLAAGVCRDPKDDQFLDAVVSGAAACLVTGDKDLLVLQSFQNIPIITPREFANTLGIV